LKDGDLRASLGSEDDFILKPMRETFFHLADVPFILSQGAGDKPRRLLESFRDGKPNEFEGVMPVTPSVAGARRVCRK
jgi:hypothetical protein